MGPPLKHMVTQKSKRQRPKRPNSFRYASQRLSTASLSMSTWALPQVHQAGESVCASHRYRFVFAGTSKAEAIETPLRLWPAVKLGPGLYAYHAERVLQLEFPPRWTGQHLLVVVVRHRCRNRSRRDAAQNSDLRLHLHSETRKVTLL